MKCTLVLFVALYLFSSCATRAKTNNTNNINAKEREILFSWKQSEDVNSNYKAAIDSLMTISLAQYNAESKYVKFKHVAYENEHKIEFNFHNGIFKSDAAITSSYIVNFIGLFVSPYIALKESDNKFFLAFWYFPSDRLTYKATTFYPDKAIKSKSKNHYVSLGALFRSKQSRLNSFKIKLYLSLQKTLKSYDHQ